MALPIAVFSILPLFLAPSTSSAWPDPPDDQRRPCRPPDPVGCREWSLAGKAHKVVVATRIGDVKIEQRKGGWVIADACNCFFARCDSGLFRDCSRTPPTFEHARQEQTCWKASGSISVEGKTGLLLRLLGELQVRVTLGGELSGCTTVTETLRFPVVPANCWRIKSREIWEERVARGVITEAETVYYWDCQLPNRLIVTIATDCGREEGAGEVSTVNSRFIQTAPFPPCIGGPRQPDPAYDGVFAEQCCRPLPPCDPVAEGTDPCCGCWAPE